MKTFTDTEWTTFNAAREMMVSKRFHGELTEVQLVCCQVMEDVAKEYIDGKFPRPDPDLPKASSVLDQEKEVLDGN